MTQFQNYTKEFVNHFIIDDHDIIIDVKCSKDECEKNFYLKFKFINFISKSKIQLINEILNLKYKNKVCKCYNHSAPVLANFFPCFLL